MELRRRIADSAGAVSSGCGARLALAGGSSCTECPAGSYSALAGAAKPSSLVLAPFQLLVLFQ
jgi:hypothetical protein